MVEVRSIDALQARSLWIFRSIHAQGCPSFMYLRSGDEFDLRSRMFALFDGVTEDPATGSANCALAGLLSELKEEEEGNFPGKLPRGGNGAPKHSFTRAKKVEGKTAKTWIGDACKLQRECSKSPESIKSTKRRRGHHYSRI